MPQVVDLSKEWAATLAMYGIGGTNKDADELGRRFVESGVRFVQVIVMG